MKHMNNGFAKAWKSVLTCGVMAGLWALVGGCLTPRPEQSYIDQVLEENLGDLQDLRVVQPTTEPPPVAASSQPSAVAPPPAPPVSTVSPGTEPALIRAAALPPGTEAGAETTLTPLDLPAVSIAPFIPTEDLADLPDQASPDSALKSATDFPSVARDVTIQPDTILWVTVEEDPSLNGKYLVNEYSAIDFGFVGLVLMNDMTVEMAEAKLRNILESRYLRKATVSVRIAKASYDRIGVSGLVMTPGLLKIGPGSGISLNDALRRAGGLRPEAALPRVKIIRNGLLSPFGPIAQGDVYPLLSEGGQPTIPTLTLANNDLVYVFAQQATPVAGGGGGVTGLGEKKILLLGEVSRQGVVSFADNEPCTLLYLLFKIGGLPKFAKADAIRIVRRDKDGRITEIIANAENLMRDGDPSQDVVLQHNDRIIVPARRVNFF
jgi:protein involved in polysaccharide export with SLBB domain